jgi:hypothetical protein
MAELKPCIEKIELPQQLKDYIISQREIHAKKGLSESAADLLTAKELQEKILDEVHNVYNKLGVKGYEQAIEPKAELPETENATIPPIKPPTSDLQDTSPHIENPEISFRKDSFVRARNRIGIDDFVDEGRTTHLAESTKAQRTIEAWKEEGTYSENMADIQERAAKGQISNQEKFIFAKHLADLDATINSIKDVNSKEYDSLLNEYANALNAADIARSEAGRQLGMVPRNKGISYSMADMMVQKKNANQVESLTEQQKEQVKKDYEEISKRATIAEEKNAMLEAKVAEYKAKLEVNREAKVPKPKEKRDYKAERQSLREQLKQQVADYKAASQKMGIASDGGGEAFVISTKMAKTIGEIAKSHISEVGDNIKEVVKRTMDEVKDLVTGISEKDIHDIIAGKYLSDEQKIAKLKAIKQGNEAKAQKIQEKIDKGDFSKETKLAFLEDMEIRRKFPKEYKEAMNSKVDLTKKQHDFEIALARDEMKRQTPVKKYVFRPLKMALNTYKAVKAGLDNSFVMIQGGLAIMANPASGVDALRKQTLDFFSEKRFDREIAAIHNNKELMYIIEKTGTKILDPKSLLEANRDETIGGNNFLNQQFKVKGKTYTAGRYTTAPFERLYTSMGNNLRLNILLQKVQDMYADGKTIETHPKDFEDLGTIVNTMTGIGKIHKKLVPATDAISTVIWSPKLLASGLNILGIGDVGNFALGGNKGYYSALTPEMRRFAIAQTVKGILMGSAIMAAWSLNDDKEVDLDPTSVTFGSVKDKKSGNSYNIFGRFTPIVRLIAVQYKGYKTINGRKVVLNQEPGGATRAKEYLQFIRGKMTPAAGLGTDIFTQETYSGQPFDPANVPKDFLPMSVSEMQKGFAEQGAEGLFKRGFFSFYGVKVSNEQDFNKRSLKVPEWRYLADKGLKVADVHKEGLDIVNKKGESVEVTDEKFNKFADKRDEIIKKEVADIMKKGAIDWDDGTRIKTEDITDDQLKAWLIKITERATKEATTDVFGEQPVKKSDRSIETYK